MVKGFEPRCGMPVSQDVRLDSATYRHASVTLAERAGLDKPFYNRSITVIYTLNI